MKKSLLSIIALASLTLLTGCFEKTSTTTKTSTAPATTEKKEDTTKKDSTKPTEPTEPDTPDTPVVKQATVKKVYNFVKGSTLNVKDDDKIDEGNFTITLSFESATTAVGYDILVNGEIFSMTGSSDSLSYTHGITVTDKEELTIAVIEKQQVADEESLDAYTITFEQGEHYKIIGITSGLKYETAFDYDTEDYSSVCFGVVADEGYHATVKVNDSEYEARTDGLYYLTDLYEDTIITVETEKMETHSITYVGATAENHLDLTNSVLPTTFLGFSEVNFKFIAVDGYAVSNVTFSDDSITSYDGYSDYTVTLPNADITVTIETLTAVILRAQANDNVKSIEFYSSIDWVGDGVVAPKGKITSFIPSDRNQFYVVVEPKDGYKPTGITGSVDDGAYGWLQGKTSDGTKYVFSTLLYKDCDLIVNLSSKRTVSLDSSCTGVSLLFDADQREYYSGDSVGFDLLLEDDTGHKVGDVTYSYVDDEGETQTETIYASSWGDHTYNFTMPDSDVTINVELITVVKKTVSYTNTATDYVKSLFITGVSSNAQLDNETTSSADFEQGETINIRINPTEDHSKLLSVKFTDTAGNEKTIDLTPNYNSKQYTAKFKLEEAGTISIEVGLDNTARTIDTHENSISYYNSNKEKVTDLGSIYDFDTFYFAINNTASEGKALQVSLYVNDEKTSLSTFTMTDDVEAYRVVVAGDIEIVVEEIDAVSITFNTDNAPDFDPDYGCIYSVDNTEDPIDISSGLLTKGITFYFYCSGYVASKVTIDGVEVEGTWDDEAWDYVYQATGDVVITIDWEE